MRTLKAALPKLILLCVMLSATVGCIGPMKATQRLKTWNREIENRWGGEVVFVLFSVPYGGVYGLFFVADVLVLNSIGFWGGTNPVDAPDPERLKHVEELDAQRHGPGKVETDEEVPEAGEEDPDG